MSGKTAIGRAQETVSNAVDEVVVLLVREHGLVGRAWVGTPRGDLHPRNAILRGLDIRVTGRRNRHV